MEFPVLPCHSKTAVLITWWHVMSSSTYRAEAFLDQLMSKARRGALLLNPFQVPVTKVEQRLDLIIEVTGAEWAREHRKCELPELQFIQDYAQVRGFKFSSKPNGTMTSALAVVFMEHFAGKSNAWRELGRITTFLNSLPVSIHHSESQPNAYLVCLEHNQAMRANPEDST
jgi:hypothetical protein